MNPLSLLPEPVIQLNGYLFHGSPRSTSVARCPLDREPCSLCSRKNPRTVRSTLFIRSHSILPLSRSPRIMLTYSFEILSVVHAKGGKSRIVIDAMFSRGSPLPHSGCTWIFRSHQCRVCEELHHDVRPLVDSYQLHSSITDSMLAGMY